MANDDTTVDPQLEDAAERRRESDPVIAATTEAKLRSVVAPIPRRTPNGTPSIPISPSAVPLRDPAQALPKPNATMMGLPRAPTVRATTVIPSIVRPSTTPPRATTAPADVVATPHSPAFERAVTAPANYPVRTQSGSQPPPFSGSRTVMGTRPGTTSGEQPFSGSRSAMGTRAATSGAPVVGRAPTASGADPIVIPSVDQPAVSRTQSQTMMGTRAATSDAIVSYAPTASGAQPVVGRAPTASGAHPIVIPAAEQPAVSRTQSGSHTMMGTRAGTTGAKPVVPRPRGTTVIPVPPIAVPVGTPLAPLARSVTSSERPAPLFATPPAPLAAPMVSVAEPMIASGERSGPLFATPPQPLPVTASPFPDPVLPIPVPVISYEPPSAPIAAPMTPTSSGVMRVPTMIDSNHTMQSSQPVAARMAAALPAPQKIVSPMVVPRVAELPPYIPAPNLGDPGEVVATVRVEKIEFTELVEKYAPLPVEPVPELAEVPRTFDARKLGKSVLRFAPLIGAIALLVVFVIGYFVFNGDGRKDSPMTNIKAPIVIKSVAPAAAPTTAPTDDAPTDDAKADDATADDAKADDATAVDAKTGDPATAAPATAAVKPVITEDKPRPARGKIYITSNKPAQIFLDGKSANATTPRQLTVRPGWHKVTLWDTASGKTVTQQIQVAADKVVTINKKFE
jgi:hypothetical protein